MEPSPEARFDTHEYFVWNFARITALTALAELREQQLQKAVLNEEPPALSFRKSLPMNLGRKTPMILVAEDYTGLRPHVYVSMALTTQRAARVANRALWSLVRDMYLDPRHDQADLSEWMAGGMGFSLVFVSQAFLNRRAGAAHYVVTDSTFTPENPDLPLGVATFQSFGYEAMPGMR